MTTAQTTELHPEETKIASLWKGYGEITRNGSTSTIFKRVKMPRLLDEPNGWSEGSLRKRISYQVERFFYQENPNGHVGKARIAKFIDSGDDWLEMEDLTRCYPITKTVMDFDSACLVFKWLAQFHAVNFGMKETDEGRWPAIPAPNAIELSERMQMDLQATGKIRQISYWQTGSYWYLDTRLQEAETLPFDKNPTKNWRDCISRAIDTKVSQIPQEFRTLIHGDVKTANIFFDAQNEEAVLYDFQYCGWSSPMRDVAAFFITSVGHTADADQQRLLHYYHDCLLENLALQQNNSRLSYTYEIMLEHYKLCVADFYRFMLSWGLWGHHKHAAFMAKSWVANNKSFICSYDN